MNISEATKALNEAVQRVGDLEMVESMCDRMYSAQFRGEPIKIKDYFEDEYDALCFIEISKRELALSTLVKNGSVKMPTKPELLDEDGEDRVYCESANNANFDHYYEQIEEMQEKAISELKIEIRPDDLMVSLCNYKGEEEGEGLLAMYRQLPVFRSKNDSFYQANSLQCNWSDMYNP